MKWYKRRERPGEQWTNGDGVTLVLEGCEQSDGKNYGKTFLRVYLSLLILLWFVSK